MTLSAVALKNVIDACVARNPHLIAWKFALLLDVLLISTGLTVLGNYWTERGHESVILLMGKKAMDKKSYLRQVPRINLDKTLFPDG